MENLFCDYNQRYPEDCTQAASEFFSCIPQTSWEQMYRDTSCRDGDIQRGGYNVQF